jgi:hypothetical protein
MSLRTGEFDRTSAAFPGNFFDALNAGDRELALSHLKAEANTPEGVLSPKAAEYNKQGEWDTLMGLQLVCLGEGHCGGRPGQDGFRVCAKAPGDCVAKAHNGAPRLTAGWYIAAGGRAAGCFAAPKLPTTTAGGPLTPRSAGLLTDGEDPFRLTKGQWQFVIDAWLATQGLRVDTRVEPVPDSTPAQESPAGDFERVEPAEADNGWAPDDPPLEAQRPGFLPEEAVEMLREMESLVERRLAGMDRAIQVASDESAAAHTETVRQRRIMEELEDRAATALQEATGARQELEAQYRANQALAQRVRQFELELNRLRNSGGPAPTAGGDDLERCKEALFGRTGELQALRDQFVTFRDRMESGGGIECHGIKFGSKNELLAWFDNQNISQPAIFLDALAILSAIRAPVKHKDETTKEWESQRKIEFASDLDASMATSFETVLPSILVGGKRAAEGGGTYDWLKSYLKTFDVWKPTSGMTTGVSHQILSGIDKVAKRAEEYRSLITDEPTVSRLAAGLVMDSVTFCHDLVMFINEQNHELTHGTAYSKEAVWVMQLECIQTIVEELSEARERVADAGRHNPAYYLWGMLRAWQIQQRYRRNHFKNDPALNGVLVRRLIMQGGGDGAEAKWAKLEALAKLVEQHHRSLTADIKKLQAAIKKGKDKDKEDD